MTGRQAQQRAVVGAVIVDDPELPTEVLVGRRSGKHAGLWEFPGGKVEPGESPESALVREVSEELGVTIAVVREIDEARHGWTISPGLVLRLYVAVVSSGFPCAGDSQDLLQWTAIERLPALDWLAADRAALPAVLDQLGAPLG